MHHFPGGVSSVAMNTNTLHHRKWYELWVDNLMLLPKRPSKFNISFNDWLKLTDTRVFAEIFTFFSSELFSVIRRSLIVAWNVNDVFGVRTNFPLVCRIERIGNLSGGLYSLNYVHFSSISDPRLCAPQYLLCVRVYLFFIGKQSCSLLPAIK